MRKTKAELEKELKNERTLLHGCERHDHELRSIIARREEMITARDAAIEKLTKERDEIEAHLNNVQSANDILAAWKDGATFFGFSIRSGISVGVDTGRKAEVKKDE